MARESAQLQSTLEIESYFNQSISVEFGLDQCNSLCQMWKVKNCKHMQLFDATENWEQEFPGAYKVMNCNSFSREAPKTPVRHREVLQRAWHSLKVQIALNTCSEKVAHGELWALGGWLALATWICEQHYTRLSGFCLFLRGSDISQ